MLTCCWDKSDCPRRQSYSFHPRGVYVGECNSYHDEVRWGSLPGQLGKPVGRTMQSDLSTTGPASPAPKPPPVSQDESVWAYLASPNSKLRTADTASDQRPRTGFKWNSRTGSRRGDGPNQPLSPHIRQFRESRERIGIFCKTLAETCPLPGWAGGLPMQIKAPYFVSRVNFVCRIAGQILGL